MVQPRDTQDRWVHRSSADRPRVAVAPRRTGSAGVATDAAVPRTAPEPAVVH
ncbi:hypothetical protein [Streptomyces venezuelae]|uniref:hypothetical protein n=1 Tax=Streptomyces venezuelae TaxID=54571 RepID=UPI0037D29EAB